MDAVKVMNLLELIEKAKVFPPDSDTLPQRNQDIITKAEADIDAELVV